MPGYKKFIQVGNPQIDSQYILYGFSAGVFEGGIYYRRANVLSSVRLPLATGKENRLRWKVKAPEKQRLHFYVENEKVHTADLPQPEKWEEITFSVVPKREGEFTEVKIRSENFIIRSRTESCFYLSEITVESDFPLPKLSSFYPSSISFLERAKIFFGDLHIHTNLSPCGRGKNGSIEENLDYCRDIKKFDFVAITDHAEDLFAERTWKVLLDGIEKYNSKEFVTIPAYEWTSDLYGHRNVYLFKPYDRIFHSMDPLSSSPRKLWTSLRENNQEAITIPHHPIRAEFPMHWDHDPQFQTAVEISSIWGSSEYYGNPLQERAYSVPGTSVRNALIKGLKLGFVGGSDAHIQLPGSGGITGVFAETLSRENILNAIRHRHCYATTGAKIKLYFTLNNFLMMGDEITVNQYQLEGLYPLLFHIAVEGTAPIEKIELFECNELIYSHTSSLPGSRFYSPIWKRVNLFI